ncbi:DUF433 domain-containing protein [Flavobacterium macrobrachii]|uniref:DUF433 domain-containing protein n=1 Tax=Flavobacterium macrobrachii TaxID=591204 RepID=A0ABS2CW33_9FLAO|nr:DUF433 domain-containing protein [Flavobacterium macrobrachii]MBM6499177.1 DUF433 domain-containing protein [Flavobacterium macrobrachii]PZO27008.1 MAG: hypothetical protein DCF13_12665 [Flavobacteriaceae bacterium]
MENTVLDRITILPDLCNGKPTIRGLRITVETILQYLSEGDSAEDIIEAYPFLEKEDIQAAVAFALKNLSLQRNDIQLAS